MPLPVHEPVPPRATPTDLGAYIDVLTRARRFILAGLVVGALVGYGYAWSRPPVYEAVATLLISRSKIGAETAPAVATPTFRAFVVNKGLIGQVINELQLNKAPRFLEALGFIRENLEVEELQQADIVRVRVRLDDAELAAKSANRLIELATALNRRVNTEESLAVRDFIRSQLDDSLTRMRTLGEELIAYKRSAQIELRRDEVQSLLDRRRDLIDVTVQLEGERASLQQAEQELGRRQRILPAPRRPNAVAELAMEPPSPAAQQASSAPPASGLSSAAAPKPGDRAGSAPAGVGSATSTGAPAMAPGPLAPAGSDRQQPSSPLSERAAQAWLSQTYASPFIDPVYEILDYKITAAKARVADLDRRRQLLITRYGLAAPTMAQLTELYAREVAQARLQAEYDLSAQIYADLFTRYEQARIHVASRSTELKIIDPAIPPSTFLGPSPTVAAILGGLTLAGFIVLSAFAMNYARTLRAD